MNLRYTEPCFLVDHFQIQHTLDQCDGLCVSDDFCGYKLYEPVDLNKNPIFFTNMMSSVRVRFL